MKSLYQLFVVVGLMAILSACSEDTPPTPATVAELCSMEANTLVQVEGKLDLPSFLSCLDSQCRIDLGDGGHDVMVELIASERPVSNMLRLPPRQFTPDDLSVVLDDGATEVDRNTAVSITGMVKRPSANDCYLDAYSLRLAQDQAALP